MLSSIMQKYLITDICLSNWCICLLEKHNTVGEIDPLASKKSSLEHHENVGFLLFLSVFSSFPSCVSRHGIQYNLLPITVLGGWHLFIQSPTSSQY